MLSTTVKTALSVLVPGLLVILVGYFVVFDKYKDAAGNMDVPTGPAITLWAIAAAVAIICGFAANKLLK